MEWNGCLLPLTNVLKELLSKMYIKILKKFDSPLDLLMHFWIRCEWVSVNDKLVHCNGLPFNKNEQSTANSYNSTSNAYPHVWHVCVCKDGNDITTSNAISIWASNLSTTYLYNISNGWLSILYFHCFGTKNNNSKRNLLLSLRFELFYHYISFWEFNDFFFNGASFLLNSPHSKYQKWKSLQLYEFSSIEK